MMVLRGSDQISGKRHGAAQQARDRAALGHGVGEFDVRRIDGDGRVHLLIGAGASTEPDEVIARKTCLSGISGLAVAPDGTAYIAEAGPTVIKDSLPYSALTAHVSTRAAAESFAAERGLAVEGLFVQPLRGRDPEKDLTIVFDLRDQSVVGVIAVDPWPAIEAHKTRAN